MSGRLSWLLKRILTVVILTEVCSLPKKVLDVKWNLRAESSLFLECERFRHSGLLIGTVFDPDIKDVVFVTRLSTTRLLFTSVEFVTVDVSMISLRRPKQLKPSPWTSPRQSSQTVVLVVRLSPSSRIRD